MLKTVAIGYQDFETSLSFTNVKENSYETTVCRICQIIVDLYHDHLFLLKEYSFPEEEKELLDTINAALQQIEEKKYEKSLLAKGFPGERIHKYGFAFQGKKVLIGKKQKLSKNNHKLILNEKYAELLIETTGTFR